MHFAHQVSRDWLAANDPAFRGCARNLARDLTVRFRWHSLRHDDRAALPDVAYALGVSLSIQGGFTVRDKRPSSSWCRG
jgi:hypothetical protein